jgi:uncharacterized OB-fold protein
MTIAGRLAALERHTLPPPRCADPFHRQLDYRESIRALCPAEVTLPAAPVCPACGRERLAWLPVQITVVAYTDAVAGVVRPAESPEEPR